MEILGALIVLGVVIMLYMLPAITASSRGHRQAAPIFVVNLFLGWTLIGWVVALAWSLSSDIRPEEARGR